MASLTNEVDQAEQCILGSLLLKPDSFSELGGLSEQHFYNPRHQLLYSTIRGMFNDGEAVDQLTVLKRLCDLKLVNRVGGGPYLLTLCEIVPTTVNVSSYAQIVIDAWKVRKVKEFGQRALTASESGDDVPEILEQVRGFLDGVDSEQELGSLNFDQLYDSWKFWEQDARPAILTPWDSLNRRLSGGLHRQRLYVIGARPGCGKTVMLAQISAYAALMKHRSLFFSLELSHDDLMGRILAQGARVPYNEITSRSLTRESRDRISRWTDACKGLPLEVDDTPGQTIEDISQKCRIAARQGPLGVVAIDYLQLLAPSKGESQVEQIDHMAWSARNIARVTDCPVVVCAQLNRKLEDHQGKPRSPLKSDFRSSGGIEQTADAAWILTRALDDNGSESKIPLMQIHLVKNRLGTEGVVQLRERFDQARFDELAA